MKQFNNLDSLVATAGRLKQVQIENRPAEDIIKSFDAPSTLFYVDPPYTHAQRSKTTGYRHEMTDNDHITLAETLRCVSGMVVLSGYDSPLYEELYQRWDKATKKTRDLVANQRTECLWLSPGVYDSVKLPLFA